MRRLFRTPEHEALYEVAHRFFTAEAVPHIRRWEEQGAVDPDLFRQAGALGLLGMQVPTEHGGAGQSTYSFNAVISEAAVAAGFMNTGLRLHTDIVLPYFLAHADADQRARWLPGMCTGELITAIAMSEPACGSDLAGIQTRAQRHGDTYVLRGAKSFITNGTVSNLVVVVARTSEEPDRRRGLTLLVLEEGMAGFTRGRPLDKLGLRYSDTAEMSFDAVEVPATNVLGSEGDAFAVLTHNLGQERISISVGAVAMARAALDATVAYAREREIFGTKLSSFQNTKFVLAEVATEVEVAEQFLDRAIQELDQGTLSAADAAKVKLFVTEVQGRAVDKCLQVFGGYGYVREFPLADMYADARVTRIYGGSSEIMKIIVAKSLGL